MFRTRDLQNNSKYVTRSKAKVIDNRDPLQKGRIRVQHPLTGNTSCCDYLKVPGSFNVPSIGDLVYIEADTGEPEYLVAWGNVTKGLDESPEIPEEFKRDVPTNRGFYTPKGHSIELDDGVAPLTNTVQDTNVTSNNRGIRITSSANNKIHIIEDVDNENQYILIQDAGGNTIKLDYKNNQLTINSIGNTSITTAQNKTETVSGNDTLNVIGNKTETVNGNLTINVNGNININSSGNTVVQASQITLNGSAGDVLTTTTDPVVDTIFGTPTTGVTTVKSG